MNIDTQTTGDLTTIKISGCLTEDQIQQIYDSVSMILENIGQDPINEIGDKIGD